MSVISGFKGAAPNKRQPLLLFFLLMFALPPALITGGCGHTSASKDAYSETISLDEWDPEAAIFAESPENEDSAKHADSVVLAEILASIDTAVSRSGPEADSLIEQAIATEENMSSIGRNSGARRIPVRSLGRLADVFNDSNHFQLAHAERMGIAPITDFRSLYHTRRPLVKVETNKDFRVDELTHSLPFLVPEAASLLHDIGRAFHDSVAARKGGDYRIIVTSVLRTPTSVRKLTRVNRNAVSRSTHQYATTFDITYTRFEPLGPSDPTSQEDLKNVLAEVLHNLRSEGRCLIKYERKSPCFHITVAR